MFNVGDIVTGIDSKQYCITNDAAICRVMAVGIAGNPDKIKVKVLERTDGEYEESVGDIYPVDARHFKLVEGYQVVSEIPEPEYDLTPVSDEIIDRIASEMAVFFDKYGHRHSMEGIREILRVYLENNMPLIGILRQHPNWDEEKLAIVFSKGYVRSVQYQQVVEFTDWFLAKKVEQINANEVKYCGKSYRWWMSQYRQLDRAVDFISNLESGFSASISFNGMEIDPRQEKRFARKAIESLDNFPTVTGKYVNYTYFADYDKVKSFRQVLLNYFGQEDPSTISPVATKELTDKINEIYPGMAVEGQKISRIVGKIGKLLGFDQIKEKWNGRDYGWNRQFAMFADAINPLEYTKYTLISLNPMDFLTASFGHGWASCQTPDYQNLRNCSHTYEGMYMSGTLSYMLDGVSMVYYTVDADYKGDEFWKQDKSQRCMFHYGNNVLVQGRVYPDGRDGGDGSLASQFRAVMQEVITTCTGKPNLWTLKKGSGSIREFTESHGTHYRDYQQYNDCTISLLKGCEHKIIHIGHNPICPECGREHEICGQLTCDRCGRTKYCNHCGCEVDPDFAIEIDGNVFCDSECAEASGYVNTTDDGWHERESCLYDDLEDEWYWDYESSYVVTEDGHSYIDEDNAREAGYAQNADGEWVDAASLSEEAE